jgi:hypothetical protein
MELARNRQVEGEPVEGDSYSPVHQLHNRQLVVAVPESRLQHGSR